jgi:hypothetical protein
MATAQKGPSVNQTAIMVSSNSLLPSHSLAVPISNLLGDTSYVFPAVYHTQEQQLLRPKTDLQQFLKDDLCTPRLDKVHFWLPFAGQRAAASPLHVQKQMGRSITASEQVDLHLCIGDKGILVKPLPAYLLDASFWSKHLSSDTKLYESAKGMLLSYAWIISREVDFKIAQDHLLLPSLPDPGLDWSKWVEFISKFLESVDINDPSRRGFDHRYQFGEFRTRPLNLIYRLAPNLYGRYLFRGYYFGRIQFHAYFKRNFSWLLIAFAYTSVVISAMQLGLATNKLSGSEAFQWASYVFAVISIIIPVVAVTIIIWVLVFLSISDIGIFSYVITFIKNCIS